MPELPNISSEAQRLGELSLPLYEVVKRQITESIMLGKLEAGSVLPSEVALSQTYGVAVGTIRRALMDLTNDGILSRRRKTGTVVTGRKPQHSLRLFFQYFRLHGLDGSLSKSVTKVTTLETGLASVNEAQKLQIDKGAPVVAFHRVRYVDDKPIMHETLTLSRERVPDFPEKAEDIPPLFYLHLLDRFGIRISAIREQIGADLATDEDARWLNLKIPAAVLTIDEIAYDQMAVPVLISAHRATTANHRYVNEVQ
ncbi:GntR family transcriptional regulator [Aliirhizobium smilacinae]|uniref:GntR family transcriptional regulator n=1 Tax=Aliirhizobium smilacinae TaxID=1395944 RepID=A0A5C4XK27_9HYPH|nr:GntR family transcriptional regulator [Rhizobium smilacinae]TNM63667.1 GntR family transcriptional regulator [Rhizobium smilacinae]